MRESVGYPAEGVVLFEVEPLCLGYCGDELIPVEHHLFPYAFKKLFWWAVGAGGEDVASYIVALFGFDMEVVAGVTAFFAVGCDVYSHMGFVGGFVFGKAGVSVNAVGAVPESEVADGGVKGRDAFYEVLGKGIKCVFGLEVLCAVLFEPFAVIVLFELVEEF